MLKKNDKDKLKKMPRSNKQLTGKLASTKKIKTYADKETEKVFQLQ